MLPPGPIEVSDESFVNIPNNGIAEFRKGPAREYDILSPALGRDLPTMAKDKDDPKRCRRPLLQFDDQQNDR